MSQNVPFAFDLGGTHPPIVPSSHHMPGARRVQPSHGPLDDNVPVSAETQREAARWPGQLSGADLTALPALQGVSLEQLNLIAHLLQSGGLTVPPMPGAGQPAHDAPAAPAPAAATMLEGRSHSRAATHSPQDAEDIDKEEGELEEGEDPDIGKERAFLRPPPTGPRKRSASPRDVYRQTAPDRRSSECVNRASSSNLKGSKSFNQGAITLSGPQTNGQHKLGRDKAAKAFVMTMYKAGYSFDQLSKEVASQRSLRRMFKQLGLPIEKARLAASSLNGAAAAQSAMNGATIPRQQAQSAESRKVSVAKRIAPAKLDDAARNEYLARLAAVTKKPENSNAFSAPRPPQKPAPPARKANEHHHAVPAIMPASSNGDIAATSMDRAGSIKQRTEALKVQQAAKSSSTQPPIGPLPFPIPLSNPVARATPQQATFQPATPSNEPNVEVPSVALQTRPAAQPVRSPSVITTQPAQAAQSSVQATISPPSAQPGRPFSSLPGLFMFGTPLQQATALPSFQQVQHESTQAPQVAASPSSAAPPANIVAAVSPALSPAPFTASRKRPLAADFDSDFAAASASSAKRPMFGQSRSDSESEKLVIEVSEDEDEEMELDAPATQARHPAPTATKSAQRIDPLGGLPPRPVSGPSTPSVATPSSAAEYAKKMADLEEAKRELAERLARHTLHSKKSKATAQVPVPGTGIPAVQAQSTSHKAVMASTQQQASRQEPVKVQPAPPSSDPARLLRLQEKERLVQRLAELKQNGSRQSSTSVEPAVSGALPQGEPQLAGPDSANELKPFAKHLLDHSVTSSASATMTVSSGEQMQAPVENTVNHSSDPVNPIRVAETETSMYAATGEEDEEVDMEEESSQEGDSDPGQPDELSHRNVQSLPHASLGASCRDRARTSEKPSDDTSSASATDPEDCELVPIPPTSPHSEQHDDKYQAATKAEDASVNAPEVLTEGNLAPELQPLQTEQTAVDEQVRGDGCDGVRHLLTVRLGRETHDVLYALSERAVSIQRLPLSP